MKWTYGVTTIRLRLDDLLPKTIDSLKAAGFHSPHLFVDDAECYYEWPGQEVTIRKPRIFTMANWYLGMMELYMRNPSANRYAMFQDDIVCYAHLREYLEHAPYPEHGYLNLYTVPYVLKLAGGKPGWFLTDQNGQGALALVFSREALVALLTSPYILDRVQDPRRGWKSIDGAIVTAMKQAGYKEYCHNPTLVQHTGILLSSMGNGHKNPPADSFRGEQFDARELLCELAH